jgi:hypothetical protein
LSSALNANSKTEENTSHDISEKPLASYDLPPPPSKDQILGNVKKIEEQYRQQVDDWNKHLDSSKKEADERLNQMLAQYTNKKSDK